MSNKKEATPLPTMLGSGETFSVAGKEYTILPLKLKDFPEFEKDQISLGAQILNLSTEKTRKTLDKWIQRYFRDAAGEPVTLNQLSEDGWTIVDLKNALLQFIDLGG